MLDKLKNLFGKPQSVPTKPSDNEHNIGHFLTTGTSGTDINSGYIFEEYLLTLRGIKAADTYDMMRRSDGQIKMLLSTIKNPIKSANWFVEAIDDSAEEVEIKEFVDFLLFEDMGDSGTQRLWSDFISEALTFLDFGFSIFEVVNKIENNERWGTYVGIRNLAFRSQKTIEEWNLHRSGRLNSVTQRSYSSDIGKTVRIDGDNLIVFSVDKEGDNFEGISLLRAIYGNWLRKNEIRKISAIGYERSGLSMIVGKYDDKLGSNDVKIQQFQKILSEYTSHQSQYIMMPKSFSVESFQLKFDAGSSVDLVNSENQEMTKAFLANFMELGLSGSGSYALGSDLSDIFLSGIVQYANKIAEVVNLQIIPKLVDAKFGKRNKYPTMRVTGINDKAGKELAEIVTMLGDAGFLKPDERLSAFLHKEYKLPEIIEDESVDSNAVEGELSEHTHGATNLGEPASEGELKFAENVSRKNTKYLNDQSDKLHEGMVKNLSVNANKYINNIEKALRDNPNDLRKTRGAVFDLTVPGKTDYNKKLNEQLTEVAEDSRMGVIKELGLNDVDFKKTLPKSAKSKVNSQADLGTIDQYNEIQKAALFSYNTSIESETGVDQVIGSIKQSVGSYITGAAVLAAATNFTSDVFNSTRYQTFEEPEVFGEIESFVFTNPSPKAAICQELAGRVFTKAEYNTTTNLPPLHHNCKSFIVAQTKEDKGNKKVDPIGLSPTGSKAQVETILKSKKF